ncbi:hypothetical protein GCM10022284_64460 [Streptomyces hundungensis]
MAPWLAARAGAATVGSAPAASSPHATQPSQRGGGRRRCDSRRPSLIGAGFRALTMALVNDNPLWPALRLLLVSALIATMVAAVRL